MNLSFPFCRKTRLVLLRAAVMTLSFYPLPFKLIGQDSLSSKQTFNAFVQINGYLKNMQTMSFKHLDDVSLDNLIHNRINAKAYVNKNLTFNLGLRNRIIYGSQVAGIANYGQVLGTDNGIMDLAWSLVDKKEFILHSTIDRLNFNYVKDNVEITVGRQRINWGLALAWNPNDLFNTYNFIDFDYEERPGSDAVRGQYYFKNGMSGVEVAANINRQKKTTVAGMYKFNTGGYDFQVLGGKYLDDIAIGIGWAGNIGDAGFKGEVTYFDPQKKVTNLENVVVGTAAFDYSFSNSIYVSGAYLFSSNGINEPINFSGDGLVLSAFGTLTAKSLFPSQSASFLTASYPISPLWNLSLAGMYGFGMNLAFVSPNISYSIREDLEAVLVGQTFYMEQNNKMELLGNGFYFRLKWSF